jgi:hypothetical protein
MRHSSSFMDWIKQGANETTYKKEEESEKC